ncbi:DAK2 domain-containing protein [Streptomyces sp. 5-6(2022)]|uniref:DAK2 domain-containing protein n=1 Tax=Streptomyces sp. 5-6(2022) TaxID=2936510 RepID=UPI0023BA3484|nr:DAK2 domain-containing protein [Streptomyces sp. 5-6(2022)]
MTDTTMDLTLAEGFGRRWTEALFDVFLGGRAQELGKLDQRAGDGDFGNNIASALGRAQRAVATDPPRDYRGWLTAVSRGFLGTGGTSGPLFGMFFRDLARCAGDGEPTLTELAHGLNAAVATVQRYGKAEVGHKTMIDALVPAARTLHDLAPHATDAAQALSRAAEAAVEGARGTAALVARRGRASYVGEVARGVLDPGAAAAAIVLQAAVAAQSGTATGVDAGWINT